MTLESEMRVFSQVLKHRSFSKAAVALGVSKPSMSRLFKSFESRFKGQLVQRKRRLELLPFGSSVLQRVDIILRETDQLLAMAQGHFEGPSVKNVRLACSPELAGALLQPVLATFREETPHIDVDLVTAPVGEFRAGDIDAFVGFIPPPVPGLTVAHQLGQERHAFVAAAGVLLGHGRPAPKDYEELSRLRFLWVGERTKQAWEVSKRRDHWEPLNLRARTVSEDPLVVLAAVAQGEGFGILPTWLVSDGLQKGTLAYALPRWKVGPPGQPRTLNFYSDPASPHASALNRFTRHLESRLMDEKEVHQAAKRTGRA